MTTNAELRVGTEISPYSTTFGVPQGGNILVPGGGATLTLNSGAILSTPATSGNLVIGQGRDDTNNNSGQIIVNTGATLNQGFDRLYIGFYDNNNLGTTKGTLTVNGGIVNSLKANNRLIVGGWDNANANNFGRGFVELNSGTINTVNVILGSEGGVGVVNHTDGASNVSGFFTTAAAGTLRNTASGTYNLSGSTATSVLTVTGDFTVHEAGTAGTTAVSTFNQSGGTVNLNSAGINVIGRAATNAGKGIYNLSGGILNTGTGGLQVGGINTGANGEIDVSAAGQLNANCTGSLSLGQSTSSTGLVNQTGGNVVIAATSTNGLQLAAGTTSSATYNLNGGTLTPGKITAGAGTTKALNFSGGTLKANATITATGFASTINGGGAGMDTNGFNIWGLPPFSPGPAAEVWQSRGPGLSRCREPAPMPEPRRSLAARWKLPAA